MSSSTQQTSQNDATHIKQLLSTIEAQKAEIKALREQMQNNSNHAELNSNTQNTHDSMDTTNKILASKRNLSSGDEDHLESHSGAPESKKTAVRQPLGGEGKSPLPRPVPQSVARAEGGSSSQGNGESNLSKPPRPPRRETRQPSKGGKPPEDIGDTSSMETYPSLSNKETSDNLKSEKEKRKSIKPITAP